MTAAGRPNGNEPSVIYALKLPDALRRRVEALAIERNCLPTDVLLDYAIQGERCSRNHEKEA